MIKQKVAVVFGLPGVGKTRLIESFINTNRDFVRLSGGSLINAELSERERDALRKKSKNQVLINQNTLIFNFRKKRDELEDKHIVFDGHCIVKNGKSVTKIPIEVIRELEPDIIIFLDEPSEVIIDRRSRDESRPDREVESIALIDRNREMQIELCRDYSTNLSIPFKLLTSPTLDEIEEVLHALTCA